MRVDVSVEGQAKLMVARYYEVGLGRFIQVDPSRKSNIMRDPQSWNRYVYAANSPLNFLDPTGQFSWGPHHDDALSALGNRLLWLGRQERVATMAADVDHGWTNPITNPELHFGGREVLDQVISLAVTAYMKGETTAGDEWTARALHLALDLHSHEDTNYFLHGVQVFGGYIQHAVFRHPNTLNPDSSNHPTYQQRHADAQLEEDWTADRIESGVSNGGAAAPVCKNWDLEIEVDASKVMSTARAYAQRGYSVYIDGVCYKNC